MAIVGCAIILFGIGIGRLERLPFQPKPKDPVIKDSQGEPYPIRPPDAASARLRLPHGPRLARARTRREDERRGVGVRDGAAPRRSPHHRYRSSPTPVAAACADGLGLRLLEAGKVAGCTVCIMSFLRGMATQ